MNTVKQMIRQPIKFTAGLILMTVAAAILCICVGQALAAKNTADTLDQRFTTVALPAGIHRLEGENYTDSVLLAEGTRDWLEETAKAGSKVIKTVAEHGIISAYIPELTPLNYTQSSYIAENFSGGNFLYHFYRPEPDGMPYSCAMLVVTLDAVSEPVADTRVFRKEWRSYEEFPSLEAYWEWQETVEAETVTAGYTVSLVGTVTEVVSLQEGYRDPSGMIARLSITVPTLEELEALELVPGRQYLVYGMDYFDEDWALRGYLADERHRYPRQIDAFDLSKLRYLTEEEKYYKNKGTTIYTRVEAYYNEVVAFYDGSIELTQREVDQINAISMTLNVPVPSIDCRAIRDEAGNLLEVKIYTDVTYTDRNGETVTMPQEEYTDRYRIPTIARLEGSVEDFLQSEEGVLWQQALNRDAINNHAFAVIGVDKLEYLADFAREESRITQGRDFSAEELSSGAKVCILHEQVAAASGLEVGATITLNLYHGDLGLPYQEFRTEQVGILTPAADFYFDTTPILETTEYTIVGTYRSRDVWVDVAENEYGFSPNTIFVPKSSVSTPLEYPDGILFTTVVLRNGKQEEFRLMAAEAGYKNTFIFYDQGYSTIASNFHNYEALAQQVLIVGASVYAVILLLFLLLFPGTQSKAVATMESLGVPIGKRFAHVMLSSIVFVAPATVLGGAIGMLLWQSVINALKASAETAVSLQLGMGTLLLIALAQFVFAMALTAIIATWVTAPKSLAERRSK